MEQFLLYSIFYHKNLCQSFSDSLCKLTKTIEDINFSLISQCGLSQKPSLSHMTSNLTKEFFKSFPISDPIFS